MGLKQPIFQLAHRQAYFKLGVIIEVGLTSPHSKTKDQPEAKAPRGPFHLSARPPRPALPEPAGAAAASAPLRRRCWWILPMAALLVGALPRGKAGCP